MIFHELDQSIERDPPIARAGDAVAAELARIEPLADGARRDIADLCNFPGRKDIFLTWRDLDDFLVVPLLR